MTDTHGMKFVVDTTGVAKGFRDYRSAVEGIFKSLDQFEAHVEKTMKGVASAANNKTALNSFKSAMSGFGKVDIDASAGKKISALSAAMSGFKAPSAAASANTKSFFKALEGLPNLGNVYKSIKSIDDLNIAMRGFKAPSLSEAEKLSAFANAVSKAAPKLGALSGLSNLAAGAAQINTMSTALGRLKVPSVNQSAQLELFAVALKSFNFANLNGSGNLFASLAAIANFKAPSAAQTKNLIAFEQAVSAIKVPSNGAAIAAYLHSISAAASQAQGQMVKFRGGLSQGGSAFSAFNSGAHGTKLEMMGLQNAFSGTFQVGSLLRSLLGTLTIGELGRSFFEATQSANQFHASMLVVTDNLQEQEDSWKRAQMAADHYGVDLKTYSDGFAKFAAAAHESGASLKESTKIYEGFQTVITGMHLGTEQQQSVGLALREGMDRGYVSTQILTRQLGLVLPGAMATAQAAWKKANGAQSNFFDALKKKQVDSIWLFDQLASKYSKEYGPALAQALESPVQQWAILKNRVTEFMQEVAKAGAQKGFAELIAKISSYLNPEDMKKYADVVGTKLKTALEQAGKAIDWLYNNWDRIKGPLSTTLGLLGRWIVVSTALKIGTTLVTPLIGVFKAGSLAVPIIFDLVRASKALAAVNLAGYLGGLSKIKSPAIAAGTASISSALGGAAGGGGALTSIVGGAAKIPGLMKTAATAVGGLAAAIGTGLTAAWLIASSAAAQSADGTATVNYSAGEIITGMWMSFTETIAGAWGKLVKWISEAWDTTTKWVGDLGDSMTKALGFNFSDIGTLAANTGFVIYYAFKKTVIGVYDLFKGLGAAIGKTLMAPIEAAMQLKKGNFAGAASTLGDAATGQAAVSAFADSFKGFDVSRENMRAERDQLGSGFRNLVGDLNDFGAKGRGKPGARPKPKPLPTWQDAVGDADGRSSRYQGANSGGGKKKKKTPTLEDTENKVENAVDQLMKRLAGDDPVAKMYQDFVKGLTDEAHVLLSSNGYQTFLKNIQRDAKDGKVTVDSLIDALQKGNLDSKTMSDLQKRYGTDVKGIIALLRQQQAEYDDAVKEATIKALDKKFKQVKDAMDALGGDNPGVKAQADMIDRLTKIGRIALPVDQFKAWVTALRDGSATGADSVRDLVAQIQDATNASPELAATLKTLGMTSDQLAASVERIGVSNKYTRQQDEEAMVFGAKLLRTRQEQITMNSLSARDAEIMTALQEEVNAQLVKGNQVSRETVEVTYQKLKAQQALADQMSRNKTFFENNGVRSYINDVKDAGAAVNDLDKNVLQSLEDQLYSLGTAGTFSFKAIFDTIQQGIVRFASQQVTKKIVESIIPKDTLDGGAPTLTGGLFKAIGLGDYSASKTTPLGSSVGNAMWVQFTGMTAGGGIGGTGVGINEGGGTGTIAGGLYSGKLTRPSVTVEDPNAPTNLLDGIPGFGSASGSAASTINRTNPLLAANDNTAAGATAKTALSFKDSITGVLPMIGLAFAGSFKSPIAQIGALFLSEIVTKMIAGGAGGAGGGGLGGIFGSIGKLFGGGGGGGISQAAPSIFSGIYKEGGFSGSAVGGVHMSPSAFVNAPHYSEGTHNTSGGMPAVLHDNEAVIPLSRNRKVPIEMKGGGGTHITQNYNISTPDANSFRKSKQQIAVDSYSVANRAFRRNH